MSDYDWALGSSQELSFFWIPLEILNIVVEYHKSSELLKSSSKVAGDLSITRSFSLKRLNGNSLFVQNRVFQLGISSTWCCHIHEGKCSLSQMLYDTRCGYVIELIRNPLISSFSGKHSMYATNNFHQKKICFSVFRPAFYSKKGNENYIWNVIYHQSDSEKIIVINENCYLIMRKYHILYTTCIMKKQQTCNVI